VSERPGEDRAETPVERLSDGGAATGPSGPAYATLAEGHRRAGRAHEAESLARAGLRVFPGGTSGRLALALALLDQRRIEEARREVEGLLESLSEFQAARGALAALIGESESEPAEPEPDVDAAMDAWAEEPAVEQDDVLLAEGASPFATQTMAGLLERQGHADDARALRARLEGSDAEPAPDVAAAAPSEPEEFALPEPEPIPALAAAWAEPAPAAAWPEPAPAAAWAEPALAAAWAEPAPAAAWPEPAPAAAWAEPAPAQAADPLAEHVESLGAFAFESEERVAELAPETQYEPAPPLDAKAERRAQVIATLERWLDNLRRGVR